MPATTTPIRPVPARILMRLRRPSDSIEHLGTLGSTLYSEGLVRREPRTLRWSAGDPAVLELACTFTDPDAAQTWLAHPKIISGYADAFTRLLRGKPRVVRDRDYWLAADDDKLCGCSGSTWLLLQGPPEFRDEVFWCGDCELPIPSRRIDEPDAFGWASAYRRIYGLWLDSGLYQTWAEQELSSLGSKLNADGRRIARAAQKRLGVPVYYDVFSAEIEPHPTCQNCRRPTQPAPWRGWRLCRRCRLSYCES